MNTDTLLNNPTYPAPFVAQVQFKRDCKWYGQHKDYCFRSDKISPNTTDNLYLHYLEIENFVCKEMKNNFSHAVIWNNTGHGIYKGTVIQKRFMSVQKIKFCYRVKFLWSGLNLRLVRDSGL